MLSRHASFCPKTRHFKGIGPPSPNYFSIDPCAIALLIEVESVSTTAAYPIVLPTPVGSVSRHAVT